jgi:hypothetical protein
MQVLQGRLLFNFNEMDAMGRAESTAVKSFVTERTDVFRAPYATSFSEFPRCCVLTGDTNQDDFLKDATGDRRCWPVHCSDINVDLMAANRDQLFAEAVHFYRLGERRYPDREEEDRLFLPEQNRWKFVDVWQDILAAYVTSDSIVAEGYDGALMGQIWAVNSKRSFFSTEELLVKALHQDIAKIDRAGSQQRAVGNAMRLLGFAKKKWGQGRARPNGYERVLETPVEALKTPLPQALAGTSVATQTDEGPAWD